MTQFHRIDTSRRSGFTLLELAIVLAVISLIIGGGLTAAVGMVNRANHADTVEELNVIKAALDAYYVANNRYPCPASMTSVSGGTAYGTEYQSGSCSGASTGSGVTRVTSGGNSWYGAVPVRSLYLQDGYMSDAWGYRYLYAVSETLTVAGTPPRDGVLTVTDGSNTIQSDIHYVVLSVGEGKKGGTATSGTGSGISCTGGRDAENCDGDSTYTDSAFNNATASTEFFDDLIRWNGTP